MISRRATMTCFICLVVCLVLAALLAVDSGMAQTAAQKIIKKNAEAEATPEPKKAPPAGPKDEYDRGTPRSSVKGYLKAARDGDYQRAAEYLDLRNLPWWMETQEGPELARKFKIVLDRTLWFDLELLSAEPLGNLEDGQPEIRESVGRIKFKDSEKSINVMLQRVQREDGVYIWKFSNRTVAEIPHLYSQFGFRPLEERLSKWFPDFIFLGWHSWQWGAFLIFTGLAYLLALLPTWFIGLLLYRRQTELSHRFGQFIAGPARIILWILLLRAAVLYLGPSVSMRIFLSSGTLLIIAFTWAIIRLVVLAFQWWEQRLRKNDQESATVLLSPARAILKIVIVLLAIVVWLDNIGFDVATLLAGLGVGGIAVALAAQDTLRNFIGSIMILLDKPYRVGQRIVAKGHDGVVEEIGLRSTKIRLLTGHLTTIPNDEMARTDIENIGRRPYIRRLFNINITYDTPPDKIEKAMDIIKTILDDHEGMDPERPPRVYFNEYNPYSLNIMVLYWYQPADYWGFMEFSQRVNMQIKQEFKKEGIEFALPTSTTYLTQDDGRPLQLDITGDSQLAGDSAVE